MRSALLFLILFSTLSSTAQNIEWGELERARGRVSAILPVSGSTFFTTRWSGSALLRSLYLSRHSNFTVLTQEKVAAKVGNSLATIERVVSFDSKIIVFLSDKQEGQHMLFMQTYDEVCQPEGEPVLVAEYLIPRGWRKSGYFNVLQSENQQFLCVEYAIPATRESNERFGFKIMNAEFTTVSEGEYESPYEAKQSDISSRYLSNTGDYFIAAKVYNLNERGRVKDLTSLEKVVLMHVTPEGIEEMNLVLNDRHITDISFSSDNSRLFTCTGLYGLGGTNRLRSEADNGITKGIFYFQLDFEKKQILNEGYIEFEKDFITEGWSDRDKKRADRQEARGKGTPAFYSYDFRKMATLKDGSLVGTMEQYYVVMMSRTDPRTGVTTTTYRYFYNDVIVYKVSPEGTFSWVKKIQKHQVSDNDYGYMSSIAQYIADDKMVVLFNDNIRNYDDNGQFLDLTQGRDIASASFRKKTNCVAKVELDLQTGASTRENFFNRSQEGGIAIPKLFRTNYRNREMIMVLLVGKKEKYGLLKF